MFPAGDTTTVTHIFYPTELGPHLGRSAKDNELEALSIVKAQWSYMRRFLNSGSVPRYGAKA